MTPRLPAPAQKTSIRRVLAGPLVVLAILAGAYYAGGEWMQSRFMSTPVLRHTGAGWTRVPAPARYVQSIHTSTGGMVWVHTWGRRGDTFKRWNGSAWTEYQPSQAGNTNDFAFDGESIWAVNKEGAIHWNGERWRQFPEAAAGEDASIAAGGGEAWVIDSSGKLSHFNGTRWESHFLSLAGVKWGAGLDPRLARTGDGAIWLACDDDVWRSDGAKWVQVKKQNDSAIMIAATPDHVWFSDGAGISSLSVDGKTWTNYSRRETGISEDATVNDIAAFGGRTWFATSDVLLEFDGTGWKKTALPKEHAGAIHAVAAGPDGSVWVLISPKGGLVAVYRVVAFLLVAIALAVVGIQFWILWRFRRREMQQHQLVTSAVLHATGDVPEELELGGRKLAPSSFWGGIAGGAAATSAAIVSFVILRQFFPKLPAWTFVGLAGLFEGAIIFTQSLVKRKARPFDPIGPGAPSRYDWGKTFKAVGGAVVFLVFLYGGRIPGLSFLRGNILWIVLFAPAAYEFLKVHMSNGALKRGDYDSALKIIRWFHFYNPSGTKALRMSGHALLLAGRYGEAEDYLRRSLASSQDRETFGAALEYLGDALMEEGRYDEAARSYEGALHAFDWNRRPYRGLAEMMLRQGRDPKLALEYAERIVDYTGISWRQRQLNGKAQDDYWSLKAWALAALGRASEVPAAIENALKATNQGAAPDLAATHYRAGMAMQALGNQTSANEHFRRAVELDPHGRRGSLAKAALREGSVWGIVASSPRIKDLIA